MSRVEYVTDRVGRVNAHLYADDGREVSVRHVGYVDRDGRTWRALDSGGGLVAHCRTKTAALAALAGAR